MRGPAGHGYVRAGGLRRRMLAVLLLAGLLAAAWHAGAFEIFSDAERVRARLAAWGPWAHVFYVASFVVLQPLGIPAFVWVLPAGILWPFWLAYPLSLMGVAGAASAGFLFARFIARDWVATRLPPRIRRMDERFAARGLRSVILFRLVFQLGAPTHWLLGLSRVGFGTYVLGTVLGAMPAVAVVAFFGERAVRWVAMHVALACAIAAALAAALFLWRRVMLARRAAERRSE